MVDRINTTKIPYFQVPNAIFEVGLNQYQVVVYIYLARCGNGNSKAFPSYQTIADKCGISKRKVIDTIAELEKFKLLKKTVRKSPKQGELHFSNLYTVVLNFDAGLQRDIVSGKRQEEDRLERKGRAMMEAAQAAGATPITITRKRAIEVGRELEAAQRAGKKGSRG